MSMPPSPYPAGPPMWAPEPPPPRNGLGISALVLGIVGVVFGFIPFLFWITGILGVLALIFGLIGRGRAGKGLATNRGVALSGAILGGLATAMAIGGLILTIWFVNDVAEKVEKNSREYEVPAVTDEESKAAGDEEQAAEEAAEEADEPLAFGETRKYADGVKLTVGKPAPFTPGEFAVGHEKGNVAVQLKITIVNDGKKTIDIGLAVPTVRDGKGKSAESVFDAEKATDMFSGKLLPGKQAVADYTFSLSPAGAKELQMELSPGLDYEEAIWVGPVK
ncbi:DUF4190 domain-containing protein [Streptomyces jumonjinensis]|uniref:DUF4190 domain-containing protein n=1 Tax=Streptomyces jumonjinensis TaxID=1945 RepID=UPI0037AA0C39